MKFGARTGNRRTETGDRKPENGDRKPENGDGRPETGERRPEKGDRERETGKICESVATFFVIPREPRDRFVIPKGFA